MLTRILAQSATQLAGLSTFSQIIFCLPLALDFLGPPSFLLLSLLLILHSFIYSTLRLLLKNTPFASLIGLLNVLNPMVPSVTALIVLWLYLNPPTTGDSAYSMKRIMMESLPGIYAASLRIVSPIFSILEGFATLLVCQVAGKITKGFIDEGTDDFATEESFEWRRISSLVLASLLYCAGGVWLYKSHPMSSPFSSSSLPPIFLGMALASVFFLTMIAFQKRKTTVIETSLVFLYVVYGAWMSGKDEGMQSHTFSSDWLSTGWGRSKPLPTSLSSLLSFSSTNPPSSASMSSSTSPILELLPSPISTFLSFAIRVMGNVFGINMGLLRGFAGGVGKSDRDVLEGWGLMKEGDVMALGMRMMSSSAGSLWKIASSLPPTLLISLCFRLLVLLLAARIIPVIRRAAAGWEDNVVGDVKTGFWDGRRLAEEPPSARAATILLSYRRMILIAVYTHLLLLNNGSQVWWRWVNIFVTLALWSLEISLEDEYDEERESIKSWKVE